MADKRTRNPIEYRDIHRAAKKLESEMSGAAERALRRLRGEISIADLTNALARRDRRAANALLPKKRVIELLDPIATQSRAMFERGGRIGMRSIKRVLTKGEPKR